MKLCGICNFEKENNLFIRGKLICKKCHREQKKEYHKNYRHNNKSKILEANRIYKQKRRLNDPSFRLANNCSRMINFALNGKKQNYSIWKFLPYTISDLKKHIELQFDENMNWNNYGDYWHLDHIVPQSHFSYTSMLDEQFLKCWSLNNLRPLEAIENIKKSSRLVYELK